MKLSGNKVLPVLAGFTVMIVIVIVFYLNDQKSSVKQPTYADVNIDTSKPASAQLDGDLPEHTLNKLSTDMMEFKDMLKGNTELVSDSVDEFKQLQREIDILKTRDRQLTKELELEKKRNRQTGDSSGGVDVESLTKTIMDRLKFDGTSGADPRGDYQVNTGVKNGADTMRRVRGVGIVQSEDGGVQNLLPDFMKKPDLGEVSLSKSSRRGNEPDPGTPVYTIPDLSILNDATAVTHMIGRVPIKGDVSDPAPFKVVLGHDNLAANGHNIPGIQGMFMEGHVWGDATLSCVRAYVERASFVFTDGRIVSFPKKKKGKRGKGGSSAETIGYLTDEYGSTCIPGRYITNAPRTLTAQFLADLATGAADAYSNKETTSVVTSTGGITTAVTGSDGKYVLGQAAASGAQGVSDYIRSRNLDIWDSILVHAGLKVAIHLQEEIPIDYSDSARKISYFTGANGSMTD